MFGLIDVLVVCPLDVEYQSLKERFTTAGFSVLEQAQPNDNRKSMFLVRLTAGDHHASRIDVCIIQSLYQGVLRAACLTSALLSELRPKLVISFGIAGLFSTDYKIGDVCFPDNVIYYEPAKDTEPEATARAPGSQGKSAASSIRQPAPISFPCDHSLYRLPSLCGFRLARGCPIASGEKLVAAEKSPVRTETTQLTRHMVGVEMEAAGVACACASMPTYRRPKFIAIKGFSDHATLQSKNPEATEGNEQAKLKAKQNQERERKKAADNAAIVLVDLLRTNCYDIQMTRPEDAPLNEERLNQKLERFKGAAFLSSVENLRPDDRQIRRAFLSPNVPAIYHFTVGQNGLVGWVDMYFLLILRSLHDECDFMPHVFISESNPHRRDIRQGVETLLSQIFEKRSWTVWWSSTIDQARELHRAYAAAHRGIDDKYFIDLAQQQSATNNFALPENKTDKWLVFQIWMSRVMPTQVILAFHKRKSLYDKLHQVPGLEPIIIYGDTLALGDNETLQSKVHGRMRELGVLPQSIEPLVHWFELELGKDPSVGIEALQRFVDYFKPFKLAFRKLRDEADERTFMMPRDKKDERILVRKLAAAAKSNGSHTDLFQCFSAFACNWKHEFTIEVAPQIETPR